MTETEKEAKNPRWKTANSNPMLCKRKKERARPAEDLEEVD